jgi:hypothetical protein
MFFRFTGYIALFFHLALALSGCTTLIEPDDQSAAGKNLSPPVISPVPIVEPLVFTYDDTIEAVSTLTDYPSVASWHLQLEAELEQDAAFNGEIEEMAVYATLTGFDRQGSRVAYGNILVDIHAWDSTGSTITINGVRLSLEESGKLLQKIAADAEKQLGKADLLSWRCAWLAVKLLAKIAIFVAASGAAIAACTNIVTLPACFAALAAQFGAGVLLIEQLAEFLCECWPGYAERNPDICEVLAGVHP